MRKVHETEIVPPLPQELGDGPYLGVFVREQGYDGREALNMYQAITDAAGNAPSPLTDAERKWRTMLDSGKIRERMSELKRRQSLSLSEKIRLSLERIREWHQSFDGNVAVSYSGGKDSEVLLWLVRSIFPDVPAVFVNTGLEYPDIVRHVKTHENVIILRPRMPFHKVIKTYGYPLISKKVARGISILKRPTAQNQNIWRLYNEGVNRFGQPVSGFKVATRWKFLADAPFDISDKCCSIMKKEPIHRFERQTGRVQFVGTMASDSKIREKTYLRHGCNAFDIKSPRSTPMGFWTEQDVLACITENNIRISPVYGEIVRTPSGKLQSTGARRTGCVFCAFGLHLDDAPNRFQLMHSTHPRLWDYCMNRLGMKDVFRYIRERCPDRNVIGNFNPEPVYKPKQMELFS